MRKQRRWSDFLLYLEVGTVVQDQCLKSTIAHLFNCPPARYNYLMCSRRDAVSSCVTWRDRTAVCSVRHVSFSIIQYRDVATMRPTQLGAMLHDAQNKAAATRHAAITTSRSTTGRISSPQRRSRPTGAGQVCVHCNKDKAEVILRFVLRAAGAALETRPRCCCWRWHYSH